MNDWMNEAKCKGQTQLFFAPAGERAAARGIREQQAVALCKVCPVADTCAQHALAIEAEHGVWAGVVYG